MKVLIEVENDNELLKISDLIKEFKPNIFQTNINYPKTKSNKQKFINYIKKYPIRVNKIEIPNREERNAR
jgi:hypothetical protein